MTEFGSRDVTITILIEYTKNPYLASIEEIFKNQKFRPNTMKWSKKAFEGSISHVIFRLCDSVLKISFIKYNL